MGGWQRFVVGGAIINATLWMGVGSILMLHNEGEGGYINASQWVGGGYINATQWVGGGLY